MSTRGRVGSWGRWVKRGLVGVVGFTLLAVAVIGFAHTKHGRSLLALMRGAPGCPVGMDAKLSPEELEQVRGKVLASVRGDERALVRPALGFVLDATTRADVERWAQEKGVRCEPAKRGAALRCLDVPVSALAAVDAGVEKAETRVPSHPVDGLFFGFDGHGRLVSLDASRDHLSAAEAAQLVEEVREDLAAQAGPPALERGVPGAEYLQGGALRQIASEFRFSDYRAQVSATNLGQKVVVREQYQSIPN
ncbi:hypothetical protein [Chondromyces apiculatus]|uniref:Uncharacterized protein n=1 Tax=Chondromyces apiculatus DSM 436 TaxID=1192034 RepID=A0A017TFS1_9BACT|nr:hypothetical protein [Chondromyces apiculatus]EYF07461.1 Hypothetical protein CAP_0214 [Chondromyces apiculatus DSM 436]